MWTGPFNNPPPQPRGPCSCSRPAFQLLYGDTLSPFSQRHPPTQLRPPPASPKQPSVVSTTSGPASGSRKCAARSRPKPQRRGLLCAGRRAATCRKQTGLSQPRSKAQESSARSEGIRCMKPARMPPNLPRARKLRRWSPLPTVCRPRRWRNLNHWQVYQGSWWRRCHRPF